jgi:hypothetical protein
MNKYDSEFSALKALAYSVGVTTPRGGWDSSYSIIASMYEHLVGAPVEAGVMPIDMLGEIQRGAESGEIVISDNCINEIERLNSVINSMEDAVNNAEAIKQQALDELRAEKDAVINELQNTLDNAAGNASLLYLSQIGYTDADPIIGIMNDDIEYSKQKAAEFNGVFSYWLTTDHNILYAPYIDTSSYTHADGTFNGCINLRSIPKYDFSNMTRMMDTFGNCRVMKEIPLLDTSNVTDMRYAFAGSGLVRLPQLDTHNVRNISGLFDNCDSIIEIPELDFTNVTNANDMLWNAINVKSLGGFKNMTCDLAIYSCYHLDRENIMNVINKLGVTGGATLTIGSMHADLLSDADIQIAINKGWNVEVM